MVKITEELISEVLKEFVQSYIDDKKIEKYFNTRFENARYYYQGNGVEIFLDDEDIDNYDDDYFFKHNILSGVVDDILIDRIGHEVDGEKTSWIIDRLVESKIDIFRKSELI